MLLTIQIILLLIQLSEILIPNTIPKKFLIPNLKAQIILCLVCAVGFAIEQKLFGTIVYLFVFGIVSYRLTKETEKNENH